jgi:hypothetical protein
LRRDTSDESRDAGSTSMIEPVPRLYSSRSIPIAEIIQIYWRHCDNLSDAPKTWIEGYDELFEFRSDIEIRKTDVPESLILKVRYADSVVLRNGLVYLLEFSEELLFDSFRTKRYPVSHWWWYLDKIADGVLPEPDLNPFEL